MSAPAEDSITATLSDYLKFLSFPDGRHPFGSVNARAERNVLGEYFVAPPYFESLWANPEAPRSAVVLAPTGAGKTALAVMLEERASEQTGEGGRLPLLTILYDDYSHLGLSATNHSLDAHLSALNYLLTINILSCAVQCPFPELALAGDEHQLIKYAFAKYTRARAQAEVFNDLERLRTPWERLQKAGKQAARVVPGLTAIAEYLNLKIGAMKVGAEATRALAELEAGTRDLSASPEVDFHRLLDLTTKFFRAVYFLVDRVDEMEWTVRDADATYALIHPLVANLSLLDRPDRAYAFKFFLWDGIRPLYQEHARPDRIFITELQWRREQLLEMLDARVRAFSNNSLSGFADLLDPEFSIVGGIAVRDAVAVFAGSSPRAVVTFCQYLVEQQLNLINQGDRVFRKITREAFDLALKKHVAEMAENLIRDERARREITSIGRVVFTTKTLNRDVFRGHSPESIRSKVGKWKRFQVFRTIGNQLSGNRGFPTEIHAFTDTSVAFLASGLGVEEFLAIKIRRCQKCDAVLIRDFDRGGDFQCGQCLYAFALPKVTSDEQGDRQEAIRKSARELAMALQQPADIAAICKSVNLPLADDTFAGRAQLIWLRVLQHLDETDPEGLLALLEASEDFLADVPGLERKHIDTLYVLVAEGNQG